MIDLSNNYNQSRPVQVNPFDDYASRMMPDTIEETLQLCEFVWTNLPPYRAAVTRAIWYFLTEFELTEVDDEERDRYKEFFTSIRLMAQLAQAAANFSCYGNHFSSIYFPFDRSLACQLCGSEFAFDVVPYRFSNFQFRGKCMSCHKPTVYSVIDRRCLMPERTKVIHWNPHEISIKWHPISDEREYVWVPPGYLRSGVIEGDPFMLKTLPREVMIAIRDQKVLKLTPDNFFHMQEETIAGAANRAWGLPRLLTLFRNIFYLQILHRYNEALALDYIIPVRLISPAKDGAIDPLRNMAGSSFVSMLQEMISKRRYDEMSWFVSPIAMQYQMLGGEATQLAPTDLMKQGLEEMLNAAMIPIELFQGNLSVQGAPMALRLFQQMWQPLVGQLNNWLSWFVLNVSHYYNWDTPKIRLQPSTMADDLERRQLMLQLGASNMIAKQPALDMLNLDFAEQVRRMFEEQKIQFDEQRKFEKKMMTQQQLSEDAQVSQDMAAPPAGMTGPITPMSLDEKATQMAQDLVIQPETQRRQTLSQLRQSNPNFHAIVIKKMDQVRQQAATQGRDIILQGGAQ